MWHLQIIKSQYNNHHCVIVYVPPTKPQIILIYSSMIPLVEISTYVDPSIVSIEHIQLTNCYNRVFIAWHVAYAKESYHHFGLHVYINIYIYLLSSFYSILLAAIISVYACVWSHHFILCCLLQLKMINKIKLHAPLIANIATK